MSTASRIVVFTSDLSYAVRKGIAEIDAEIPGLSWLVVLHAPRKPIRQLLRNQWRNLRRNGWRWIPYQVEDLWQRFLPRTAVPGSAVSPGAEFSLSALLARPNLQLARIGDIHAPDSLAKVREFAPELGLSLAAPILRRSLFSLPVLGTINLHKGRLPEFRGMPPAFWELWHDQTEVGCSVHWVDDRLDTGDVLAETRIDRARFSTVRGLQLRLDEVGVDLMRDAVKDIIAGHGSARAQQSHAGVTHRKPTLVQVAALKRKLALAAPAGSPLKRAAKEAYSELAYRARRWAINRIRPRVTVLLYHRVSDDARDNLTVGVEQFDRQMALLRRRFRVMTIEEVLACETVPYSGEPMIAVTFDDGYLDNYLHAAPILRRHGVPAAFFVATGIVDRQGRFPHDVRRGNPPIPVMNWDQLREMQRWGFTIGSHTVNHIDCAAEPEAVVREELARSRDDLARELGLDRPILAYPYGGRQHMTPERLALVRETGYVGCLSAYGGTNAGSVDRFNVRRRSIHWEFSDRALRLECLGLK